MWCSVMLEDIPVQNREEWILPQAESQPSGSQITNTTPTLPEENIYVLWPRHRLFPLVLFFFT